MAVEVVAVVVAAFAKEAVGSADVTLRSTRNCPLFCVQQLAVPSSVAGMVQLVPQQ